MALDTGGFQVRRLPQHQPMDPRLFVEQPIQLGDIAREGIQGFNRGRQMAGEEELRQARLAQLEQQMAQQEQMAPLEQQQAQARLGGLEQESRLQELQLQEAAQQQAFEEERRKTLSEILEEGNQEGFEGFDDPMRERIYKAGRIAQALEGTQDVPSRETFRSAMEVQLEREDPGDDEAERLVPVGEQEFGEDGPYRDPETGKGWARINGEYFTSAPAPTQRGMATQRTGEGGEQEQIVPVPTEASRQIRQALDDWQELEDQTSSTPGSENRVKRRLRRYVNQYGRASIEEQGLLLPEDLDLEFNTEDLPDDIQEMYETSTPEVKEMIEREWEEGDIDGEQIKEKIELQNKVAEVDSEIAALREERIRAQSEPSTAGQITARLSQALGGPPPREKRSVTEIDTEIAKKTEEKRNLERALFSEEQEEEIMDEDFNPMKDFNNHWMNRFMGGANVPSQ